MIASSIPKLLIAKNNRRSSAARGADAIEAGYVRGNRAAAPSAKTADAAYTPSACSGITETAHLFGASCLIADAFVAAGRRDRRCTGVVGCAVTRPIARHAGAKCRACAAAIAAFIKSIAPMSGV
jgi:capsid protein